MHKFIIFMFLSIMLISAQCTANNKEDTDYSKQGNWLSVPASLEKETDVFYLYPTVWMRNSSDESIVCDINNQVMRSNAKEAFEKSATAFLPAGNVYAPYYRQASFDVLSLPKKEQTAVISGIPVADAMAAFDYYIKNCNNGRPFMLAAHSQGSEILLHILSDYMKAHPDVYRRMIAAYVIGYSVTKDYLADNPHLKFAQNANDTGVIISYNTEAPDVKGVNPVLLPNAIVINPITWTLSETLAKAAENRGSRMQDKQGKWQKVENYADAKVDAVRGVVICSTADENLLAPGTSALPRGVYHSYDYPFYYYNIMENAVLRANNFLLLWKNQGNKLPGLS